MRQQTGFLKYQSDVALFQCDELFSVLPEVLPELHVSGWNFLQPGQYPQQAAFTTAGTAE